MDTIKESDIAKYYGDNSGSAYVLYYQALDLDVTALGLRPPPSAAPSPQPTSSSHETPSSAQSITTDSDTGLNEVDLPALPPGLVQSVEQPSSEPEAAPALPNPQGPPLVVTIPPNSSDSNPSTPTAPATPTAFNSLIKSLRHSPSIRARKPLDVVKTDPPPPLPPTSASSSSGEPSQGSAPMSTSTTDTSLESYVPPPTPTKMVNGKEKEPERKPSLWFSRRKSVRDDKTKGAPSSFPSLGDSGSSNWFKHPGRLGRRVSDVGLHEGAAPASLPSSPRLDAIPSPIASPTMFNSATLHGPPDHKKSTPEFANGKKRLPQRPSTAGATMTRPRSTATPPPLPPLPNSPSVPNSQRRVSPLPHNTLSSPISNSHPDSVPNGTPIPSFEVKRTPRPQSSSASTTPGLGLGSSNGTSSTLNTSSHSGEGSSTSTGNAPPSTTITRKRASRKLSLTGTMLSFGRKDRDKSKDKTISSPPTTHTSGGVKDR